MRFLTGIAAASLVCLGCVAAFAARPTLWTQLVGMASFLVVGVLLLVCMGWTLMQWKVRWRSGLIAALAALAAIPVGVEVGHAVRDWRFQRDLPRYHAAAAWASASAVPGDTVLLYPPAAYADLAYAIHVRQDDACGVMVDFFWGGGFPVKHTVRRYASDPAAMERKACREDWRRGRQRAEGWYELSD